MSRDITACCSIIQQLVPDIISKWPSDQGELRVIQTVRTTEEQEALYAQGRTAPGSIVTACDGVQRISMHQQQLRHGENACHAVDFGIFIDGAYVGNSKPYGSLATLVSQEGLRSGRPWLDFDHAECLGV